MSTGKGKASLSEIYISLFACWKSRYCSRSAISWGSTMPSLFFSTKPLEPGSHSAADPRTWYRVNVSSQRILRASPFQPVQICSRPNWQTRKQGNHSGARASKEVVGSVAARLAEMLIADAGVVEQGVALGVGAIVFRDASIECGSGEGPALGTAGCGGTGRNGGYHPSRCLSSTAGAGSSGGRPDL